MNDPNLNENAEGGLKITPRRCNTREYYSATSYLMHFTTTGLIRAWIIGASHHLPHIVVFE